MFILQQHHYVTIYFDDYGYASLSYAGFENNAGMSYGLDEIFQFLKAYYLNWGGRVLYFFFEIIIFRLGGLPLMQVVQAVIIVLIVIISGKIVSFTTKSSPYKCIALELVLRNHYELINAGKEYKDGGTVEKIVLHKLKNDTFAQMMPYQEGYGYIEVWMKKYYELPVGMVLEWE